VVRTDYRGNRIVTIPELGWETAPGDPKAVIEDAATPAATGQDDLFATG
jgi:hypothetical protein